MRYKLIIVCLGLFSFTLQAGELISRGLIENCDFTPFQFSLGPPVQLFASHTEVYGIRMSLLGYNSKVWGLDLGLMNFADNLIGLQTGFMNGARRFDGIQMGFVNFAGGLSALGEIPFPQNTDTNQRASIGLSGIQIGVMNDAGNMGPMSNSRKPSQSVETCFSGVQIGIGNFADEICGVQLGALGNLANEIHGLQISVFCNYAHVLHGVQIGLINCADNGILFDKRESNPGGTYGVGFPIINMAF